MKKFFKVIIFLVVMTFCVFMIFITEECIRLNYIHDSKPLIVTDQTKYSVSALEPGEEMDIDYFSLGFKLRKTYCLDRDSTEDNKMVRIAGEEFYLFNKYLIWAWIS